MKITNLLSIISLLILLSSCVYTEEVHIKNDGSGSYNFTIDMGPMMQEMQSMGTKDSLKPSNAIDTTFIFNDILEEKKDSIAQLSAEDKASIKALAGMKLRMQVDEEQGEALMAFGLDFNNISEVKNMEEKLFKAMAMNKKQPEGASLNKSNVVFSFDGKNFARKTILKTMTKDEEEKVDTQLEQSSSFLQGSTYTLIYHFEKKIKKVSYKDAKISDDGKSVTIEVAMDSLIKYPKMLDFELRLK